MPRFCANLGFLFTEADFLERFAAAAHAGFRGVEFMSPYAYPAAQLAEQLAAHQLELVLFNLPAGDWAGGERGLAALPGREAEFRAGVDQAIAYATALGCRQVNALAGIPPAGSDPAAVQATFLANLRDAAPRLAAAGIRLLIEPINSRIDMPGFWLDQPEQALALMAAAQIDNLWLQYDFYHAWIMQGESLPALLDTLRQHHPRIAHLQLADYPGRHEPGTGCIDYARLFACLDALGYPGWIGCEYRPRQHTAASLAWRPEPGGLPAAGA